MNQINIVIIVVAAVLILIVAALILVMLKHNTSVKIKVAPAVKQAAQAKEITLADLARFAVDKDMGRNELFLLSKSFVEKFSIPAKQGGKVTQEAQEHLNFISKICAHKNVDAKIVAFLSGESKKKNPAFLSEIDKAERDGINSRKRG